MPCNPNIGGSSKGHLVKRKLMRWAEKMGKILIRLLYSRKCSMCPKGPAVHSLRAQADKQEYTREMRKTLENTGASHCSSG